MSGPQVDELVQFHGEKYRLLITDALAFLDDHEPKWGIKIDQDEFIQDLVTNAKIGSDQ